MVRRQQGPAAGACALCAAVVLFASATLARANVPSIDQVYQAARGGHLAQAEAMTQEVLHAYPKSARAHYVMAQILAAEGRNAEAQGYLQEAERLKPGLPFANPQSVAKLEQRINGEGNLPKRTPPGTDQTFHWWWLLVGGVLLFVVLRALRGRRPAPSGYSGGGIGAGGAGPVPGIPPAGYSGWGGGGLLGSILAGLGFGAGAAAGERAIDHFLGGEQRQEPTQPEIQEPSSGSGDLGGDAFGVQPGDSSSGGWKDSGGQNASQGANDDSGASSSDDGGWDDSSGGGGDVDV